MGGSRRPDADEVARRILILNAVQARVRIELEHEATPESCKAVADWLRRNDLHESASIRELKFLNMASGKPTKKELIQLSWRSESCGVLLWAAKRLVQLPAWDSLLEPSQVLDALADAGEHPDAFVSGLRLRPSRELDRARDVAELWHWRARTTQVVRKGTEPPKGWTFEKIVRTAAAEAFSRGDIPKPLNDDFPAFGKAYRDLNEDEYIMASSIAMERHFALNWLCGCSEDADWEATPTDT